MVALEVLPESEGKLAMLEKPEWFYRQSGVIAFRVTARGPEVLRGHHAAPQALVYSQGDRRTGHDAGRRPAQAVLVYLRRLLLRLPAWLAGLKEDAVEQP